MTEKHVHLFLKLQKINKKNLDNNKINLIRLIKLFMAKIKIVKYSISHDFTSIR